MVKETTTKKSTTETNNDPLPSYRRLYRLPKSGKLAGVCAGLSDYLEMDVTLIRVIFVVLTLASGGFGILAYLILAVVIPADENRTLPLDAQPSDIESNISSLASEMRSDGTVDQLKNMLGIGLVLLGAWLLLVQFFPQWLSMNWDVVWPALLIVLGLVLVARSKE